MSRNMFRLPLIIFVLSVAGVPARPQTMGGLRGNTEPLYIVGTVRFAQGGTPANEVIVRLEALMGGFVDEVRTDRSGKFRFGNLSPVQYHVVIRQPGFKEIQREVNLVMVSSENLQLQLVLDDSASATSVNAIVDANAPSAATAEFQKAETLLAAGGRPQTLEAARHLEKAIQIYPRFLQAALRLGAAYMDLQDWDKAEQALKKALEIEPKTVNASFALGEVYLHQKKFDQAESVLQQGMSIETRSARAHLTLARVLWERVAGVKDETQWRPALEKSYQEVKQALELDPGLADAHLLKGNLYFKVRRAEDALHEFEEYLRLDPKGQFAEQTRTLAEKIKKALAEQTKP